MLRLAAACDPAFGLSRKADFFTIATAGLDTQTGLIHLLDMFHERGIQAPDQPRVLEQHFARWRPRGLPYVLVEKEFSRTGLLQYLARRGLCAFKPLDPRKLGDKETRAMSLAARYEAHQIIHPSRAAWLSEYEDELLAFPNGEHDDMVDAVTYAVDELVLTRGQEATNVQYHEFTYDADARPTDDSGLYAELGIGA